MAETDVPPPDWRLPSRYLLADDAEFSQARPILNRLYAPFRAVIGTDDRARHSDLNVRIYAATWGSLSMSSLRYSRAIDVEPEDLGDTLLVTTAARGNVSFHIAGQPYGGPHGRTVVALSEDRPMFRYGAQAEVIKLGLRHEQIDATCWRLLGHQGSERVRFCSPELEDSAHQRWLILLNYLLQSLEASGSSGSSKSLARGVEELLILHLLSTVPHNYSAALQRDRYIPTPREYRHACNYIAEHLQDEITLGDVAQAVGCSIRSLSRAFRQVADTSPMRYVQELRLQQVNAELSSANQTSKTISEIASLWGFGHLGEFNRYYRRRFGEPPSQTRARARA